MASETNLYYRFKVYNEFIDWSWFALEEAMIVSKQVADMLTGLRVVIAFGYPIIGASQGADALPLAIWLLFWSWTTDALDGPLARRSSRKYQTWIGDKDLEVDMTVSVGLLIYMLQSGFAAPFYGTVYLLALCLMFWRVGVPRSMGMLVQAPIYFRFIWVAMSNTPDPGYWLLVFIVGIIVVTWPRFPEQVIPDFIDGFKET